MPWIRVLSFTDPFAYQSAFRSVDVELFPTSKGRFSAELTQVTLSKLWVHGAHEDLPRVYIGAVKPHCAAIGFLTRPNQPAMLHCGMTVSPGDIIINDIDLMYRRTEANCDWGSMSLSKDDLDATCQAVTGHEYAASPLQHLVRPAPELMSRGLLLGNDQRRPPSRHNHRPVRGIPGDPLRPAAVSDGDLRGDRRRGTNAARRLRGAFGHGPNSLPFLAENASCPPRASGGGSVDDDRHPNCDRSRLLGTGPLRGRLPGTIWRATIGILAAAFRRPASMSESPVFARKPDFA